LIATGTPASAPTSPPWRIRASKARAASLAASGVGVQNACNDVSSLCWIDKAASTTSAGESDPALTRLAISAAPREV